MPPFGNRSPGGPQHVLRRDRAHLDETCASPEAISGIDDTSSPKQGNHPVGGRRPYGGALGKEANGPVAPSVHPVAPEGPYPLDLRLDPPDGWLADPKRLDQAGKKSRYTGLTRPALRRALPEL